jgi:hypothetical protein
MWKESFKSLQSFKTIPEFSDGLNDLNILNDLNQWLRANAPGPFSSVQ